MNTERSKRKVTEFLKSGNNIKRKTHRFEKTYAFPPEEIFPQLCPSLELDWLNGWDCDLIYTSTGYAEEGCIFSTAENNSTGPGLWICTRYEPNRNIDYVRVVAELLVIYLKMRLIINNDNTSTLVQELTFTALNESGNAIVESMQDNNPMFKRAIDAMDGLEYFLETGEMMAS